MNQPGWGRLTLIFPVPSSTIGSSFNTFLACINETSIFSPFLAAYKNQKKEEKKSEKIKDKGDIQSNGNILHLNWNGASPIYKFFFK